MQNGDAQLLMIDTSTTSCTEHVQNARHITSMQTNCPQEYFLASKQGATLWRVAATTPGKASPSITNLVLSKNAVLQGKQRKHLCHQTSHWEPLGAQAA